MGVPALGPTASLCRDVEQTIRGGGAVVLHCRGGLGRTGTLAAAVLVWMGWSAKESIDHVRAISRGYIQNQAQADFVHRFAGTVGAAGHRKEEE
jgi:atypical dual specificity phosphatase